MSVLLYLSLPGKMEAKYVTKTRFILRQQTELINLRLFQPLFNAYCLIQELEFLFSFIFLVILLCVHIEITCIQMNHRKQSLIL